MDYSDLIGPGALKIGLKALNHVVPCEDGIKILDEITSSHAYTKHRIDNATDTISDIWDS